MSFTLNKLALAGASPHIVTRCEHFLARAFDSPEAFETYMASTPTEVVEDHLIRIPGLGLKCVRELRRAYPQEVAPAS